MPRKIKKQKQGYIYVLTSETTFKFGFTSSLEKRLKQLRRYESELTLYRIFPASLNTEQQIHRKFSNLALESSEWYPITHLRTISHFLEKVTVSDNPRTTILF